MNFFKKHEARLFYLVLPLFLFLVPFVNAAQITQVNNAIASNWNIAYPLYEFVPANKVLILDFHIFNITGIVTDSSANCTFHLYDNLGNHIITNKTIHYDKSNMDFSVQISASTIFETKRYCYITYCNSTSEIGFISTCFLALKDTTQTPSPATFPVIYMIIILSYVLLIFGYLKDNKFILTMDSFLLMATGVYILLYGLFGIDNWIINGFGLITICIGVYVGIMANEVEF